MATPLIQEFRAISTTKKHHEKFSSSHLPELLPDLSPSHSCASNGGCSTCRAVPLPLVISGSSARSSQICEKHSRSIKTACMVESWDDTCREIQIVQRMSAVSEGGSSAPLYAYCGHDTTIMPILASLGIQLRDWPPYLSHVVCPPQQLH